LSPLTKVFIVLLVLASLLQTAGTVVFINKVQPLKKQLSDAQATADTKTNENTSLRITNGKLDTMIATAVATSEGNLKAATAVIQQLQNQISALNVSVAQLNQEKAARDAQIATITQQINWAQATTSTLTGQVTTLRGTNDKLVKQQEDDSRKIAELTSLSETEKSQLDNAREQLASAQDNIEKLKVYIRDRTGGPAPDLSAGYNPVGPGAPPINGLIREKKEINGSTYVTITVGSADGVTKGMRFNVIDNQSGDFLGFVTIDTVDNNDSIGRLDGQPDKINRVQNGNEVKTQIRGS
jgi:TolA-binding protein